MGMARIDSNTPTMGRREWAMLLALAVLWGGSFFFNAVAVRELPSFTLVWLRVAVAATTLLLVLRLLGSGCPPRAGSGPPSSAWGCSTMWCPSC